MSMQAGPLWLSLKECCIMCCTLLVFGSVSFALFDLFSFIDVFFFHLCTQDTDTKAELDHIQLWLSKADWIPKPIFLQKGEWGKAKIMHLPRTLRLSIAFSVSSQFNRVTKSDWMTHPAFFLVVTHYFPPKWNLLFPSTREAKHEYGFSHWFRIFPWFPFSSINEPIMVSPWCIFIIYPVPPQMTAQYEDCAERRE